jgi:hypothetical protein
MSNGALFSITTKKERQGSRVKSLYFGRGELAQMTEAVVALQREDRKLMNETLKQEQDLLDALGEALNEGFEL